MNSAELVAAVKPGLSIDEALKSFVAACKRHDTLFITERWFAPRREKLLVLLSDPITEDEAFVLREVLSERVKLQVLFDWLAEKPVSWAEYQRVKKAEAEARRWRTMAEGIFPWEDVEGSRADAEFQKAARLEHPLHAQSQTKTCPCCHAPVTWIYFRSPGWTWQKPCGRAGWLGVCDRCHFRVDRSW
jgi:hypothetical protein